MKRYTVKDMEKMSGIRFAMDVLNNERSNRDNPYSPVAKKLAASVRELEIMEEARLTWCQMSSIFTAWEAGKPDKHLTGYVVFTKDTWPSEDYAMWARTYVVSSDNKAFQPEKGGYSIFGSCLDGTDVGVRLERYMAAERGGKDGWKVDYCLLVGYRA